MQQAPAPAELAADEPQAEHELEAFGDEFSDELESFDPPPPPMAHEHEEAAPAQAWLQPKPSAPSADDLPPLTAMDAEPVAEEDAAGQGLGFLGPARIIGRRVLSGYFVVVEGAVGADLVPNLATEQFVDG